jgi:hypothetical protein
MGVALVRQSRANCPARLHGLFFYFHGSRSLRSLIEGTVRTRPPVRVCVGRFFIPEPGRQPTSFDPRMISRMILKTVIAKP